MNDRLARRVRRRINARLQRIAESAISQAAIQTVDVGAAFSVTDQEEHLTEIEECVAASVVIKMPYPPTQRVPLRHFSSLAALTAACLLAAFVVWMIELMLAYMTQVRGSFFSR